MMEELGNEGQVDTVVTPGWLGRRLIWPLKAKLLRTLPFKVGFCQLILTSLLKVFLIGFGVSLYFLDIGLDVDSCLHWVGLTGCFRLNAVNAMIHIIHIIRNTCFKHITKTVSGQSE